MDRGSGGPKGRVELWLGQGCWAPVTFDRRRRTCRREQRRARRTYRRCGRPWQRTRAQTACAPDGRTSG